MPLFPKVQSPCPYKSQLSAVMDGDFCRMCERKVFDITDWSDGERTAFLAGCQEEVCVSYRLPFRAAVTALAAAAAAMPGVAAAQDAAVPAAMEIAETIPDDVVVIVGGITDPANAEFVQVTDQVAPDLPVVYEDEAAGAKGKAEAATRPAA
jgi:predicted Fe-S protein YdhL (DUF1289 family)